MAFCGRAPAHLSYKLNIYSIQGVTVARNAPEWSVYGVDEFLTNSDGISLNVENPLLSCPALENAG